MGILIILLFAFFLWVFISLEKRSIAKIQKTASERGWIVKSLRLPEEQDGRNPMPTMTMRVGNTRIFGFSGEQSFDRVLVIEQNGKERKLWARVYTSGFIPVDVKFEKML